MRYGTTARFKHLTIILVVAILHDELNLIQHLGSQLHGFLKRFTIVSANGLAEAGF
jgi:hypothetical protein